MYINTSNSRGEAWCPANVTSMQNLEILLRELRVWPVVEAWCDRRIQQGHTVVRRGRRVGLWCVQYESCCD
jgi:hypothetical protein